MKKCLNQLPRLFDEFMGGVFTPGWSRFRFRPAVGFVGNRHRSRGVVTEALPFNADEVS